MLESPGGTFLGRVTCLFSGSGNPGSRTKASSSPSHSGPKIPISSFPSPSQSPMIGSSPLLPRLAHKSPSSHTPSPFISNSHSPSLNKASSSLPSPLKSPASCFAPAMSKASRVNLAIFVFVVDTTVHCPRSIVSMVQCVGFKTTAEALTRSRLTLLPVCGPRGSPALIMLKCHVYSST